MQLSFNGCRAAAAAGRAAAARPRPFTHLQLPRPAARRELVVQVRSGCPARSPGGRHPARRLCLPPSSLLPPLPADSRQPFPLPQAYQDAAPSSPWPRQPGSQQPQAAAPSSGSGNGSATAAAPVAGAASQQQARKRVTAYRGLSAAQFQHPLDQQNTALLRALPGLEMVARCALGKGWFWWRGWYEWRQFCLPCICLLGLIQHSFLIPWEVETASAQYSDSLILNIVVLQQHDGARG